MAMKTENIITPVTICSYSELAEEERELVDAAKKSTYRSYAPYSRFHVGAALRLADGTIVCGANQENAAFPSSLCAERTACYYAGATYPDNHIRTIAIAARNCADADNAPFQAAPIAPCGACRQALLEYEKTGDPIKVILFGADKIYIIPSVAHLLPVTFTEF